MDRDSQEKPAASVSTHPLEAALLIALFVCALLFGASVLKVFSIPYGIDYGEGYLANASYEIIKGNNPYHPISSPPWIVTSYPPLFPVINGALIALTGPSLIPGRFIATASFFLILVLAGIVLKTLGTRQAVPIIAAGFLLAFAWTVNWAQVVRVDTLGIFLSLLGIYFWVRSAKRSDSIVAAILFSLALFTKQSLLAAPVAAVIYGIISRDRRTGLFVILLILVTGAIYLVANFITGGGLLYHLFGYTANAYFAGRLTAGLGQYFRSTWLLNALALSAFLMPGTLAGPRRFLGLYFFLSILTLAAYGFEGSDTNYFIEPILAASLLAGLSLDRFISSREPLSASVPSPRTIGFAIALAIVLLGRFVDMSLFAIHRVNPERMMDGMRLIRLVNSVPGDVLSEDASFTFLAGKPVLFQPYIMTLLSRTGKWDQGPLIESIENEGYSLIILRVDLDDPSNTEVRGGAWEAAGFDRWTPEMEEAIKSHYTRYGAVDVGVGNLWNVYIPNSQQSGQSIDDP
jgi:hypothetical protein